MLKILAAISTVALVVPAFAQAVYDNNNNLVGPLVSTTGGNTGLVMTKLNGDNHFLKVAALGILNGNRSMYYQSANCQGSQFLLSYNPSADILPLSFSDGQTLWAVKTSQVGNYHVKSTKFNQTCTALGGVAGTTVQNLAPAVHTTVTFSGPLSVH